MNELLAVRPSALDELQFRQPRFRGVKQLLEAKFEVDPAVVLVSVPEVRGSRLEVEVDADRDRLIGPAGNVERQVRLNEREPLVVRQWIGHVPQTTSPSSWPLR
jgi:hypothetical protein